MATSPDEIKQWLESAVREGATHMIVVCDTFDWEDYPVSVMPNESVMQKINHYDHSNMQKIMEVYDLSQPLDAQFNMKRAGKELVEQARQERK